MDIKQPEMDDSERVERLTKMLNEGSMLCTGDQLLVERPTPSGEMAITPFAIFVKKNDDSDDDRTYLATPTGVPLFPCDDFYEFALDKCREQFLENMDRMLRAKVSLAKTG